MKKLLLISGAVAVLLAVSPALAQDTSHQGKHYDSEAGRWILDDPTAPANVDPLVLPTDADENWENDDQNAGSKVMGGTR